MTWFYLGEEFTSDKIQKNQVGFVYLITNKLNGMKYIGKKIFRLKKTIQRNKKKKKIMVESDWKEYFGSSEKLSEDVKKFGIENFHREILYLCENRRDMTYYEVREQFLRKVLEDPMYYNLNILGKFFLRDHTKTLPFSQNMYDLYTGEYRPLRKTINKKFLKIRKPFKRSLKQKIKCRRLDK